MPKKKPSKKTKPSLKAWFTRLTVNMAMEKVPADGQAPAADDAAPLQDEQVEGRLLGLEAQPFTDTQTTIPRSQKVEAAPPVFEPEESPEPETEPEAVAPAFVVNPLSNIPEEAQKENIEELRSQATDGYEVAPGVFAEEPKDSPFQRMKGWYLQQTSLMKIAVGTAALLVLVGLIGGAFFSVNAIQAAAAARNPLPVIDPSIPYPVAIILPDGQTFDLKVGRVTDVQKKPKTPEWVANTEVPRWLVIPYTVKLHWDVSRFKKGDSIILKMSNHEVLDYTFQTWQSVPLFDLTGYHAKTPDLLIVLGQPRGDIRYVLIAQP